MGSKVLSLLGVFLIALGITVTALQALALHYLQLHPLTGYKYVTYSVAFFSNLRASNGSMYTLTLKGSYMRVELLPNGSYVIHLNGTAEIKAIGGRAIGEAPINVTALVPKGNPLAELLVLPQGAEYAEVDGYQFPLYFSNSGTFVAFGESNGYYELSALVPGESVDACYVKLGNKLVLAELNDNLNGQETNGVGAAFLSVLELSPFVKGLTSSLHPNGSTLMLFGISTDVGLSSELISKAVGLPIGVVLIAVGIVMLYLSKRR